MKLTLGNRVLEFLHASVEFGERRSTDLFGKKNNKTLRQTLQHPKYVDLRPRVLAYHDLCRRPPKNELVTEITKRPSTAIHRMTTITVNLPKQRPTNLQGKVQLHHPTFS